MIHFQSQRNDEEVLLTLRQHPIIMVPGIALGILLLAVTFLALSFPIGSIFPGVALGRFIVVVTLLWLLFVFFVFFQTILSWYYNVYLVTNQRIVDIDFIGIVHKEVSETALSNIQDVTTRSRGFIQVLFGIGNVHIQTAGAAPEFEFLNISRPEHVVREIGRLARETRQGGHHGRP